jgi:hypothetical protein
MKIQLLFGCVLVMSTNGVVYAQNSHDCEVQVIFNCETKCESVPGSAELSLNFDKKVGTFCRGERCDDGGINFLDEKGRLNAEPYRVFKLQSTGSHKFSVFGVLDKNGNVFGSSDEIGNLA